MIHGFRLGMGAFCGKALFYIPYALSDVSSLMKSSVSPDSVESQIEVTTFDAFARQYHLKDVFVKVDVETAEFEFLQGAKEENHRIRFLLIEILRDAHAKGLVKKLCEVLGANAYYLGKKQLSFSNEGEFSYEPGYYHWLFCRESPEQLRAMLAPFGMRVIKPKLVQR